MLQGRPLGLAPCASALLGGVISMIIVGLTTRFDELFATYAASTAPVTGLIVGAAMITLAIGVRVPQRLAVWVCVTTWRRFVSRGQPADMSGVLLSPVGVDRPLHCIVLSVIALVAGLLTALLPLNVRLAGWFYHWMHAHFVWSVGPLALLEAAIVFLTGLAPLAILGLAVSCVHHLSCPYGRWDSKATAWLLLGAAGGTLIATGIAQGASRYDLTLVAAALPVLFLSLVAAISSSPRAAGSHVETGTQPQLKACADIPLPTCSDRRPRLMRTSIVAAGGAGACVMSIWVAYQAENARQGVVLAAAMLLAAGIGGLAGCPRSLTTLRSIGGFGLACVVAGVIVAVGPVMLSGSAPVAFGAEIALACSSLAAIGLATAYGRHALLRRVASRSAAGATILARMLICAALTVWIGAPTLNRIIGRPATLMLAAIVLITLGATLISREPIRQTQTDPE